MDLQKIWNFASHMVIFYWIFIWHLPDLLWIICIKFNLRYGGKIKVSVIKWNLTKMNDWILVLDVTFPFLWNFLFSRQRNTTFFTKIIFHRCTIFPQFDFSQLGLVNPFCRNLTKTIHNWHHVLPTFAQNTLRSTHFFVKSRWVYFH